MGLRLLWSARPKASAACLNARIELASLKANGLVEMRVQRDGDSEMKSVVATRNGWPKEKQLNIPLQLYFFIFSTFLFHSLCFIVISFTHSRVFNIKLSSLFCTKYFQKIFSHCNLSVLFTFIYFTDFPTDTKLFIVSVYSLSLEEKYVQS